MPKVLSRSILNRWMNKNASVISYFQRREICQITSQGTKINGLTESNYLTAICGQKSLNDGQITVGVCFVDTSMGQVHLSQFEDDKQLSCLETILAFYPPIGNYLYKSKFYPETNFWNYVFMSHLPSQQRLAQEVMSGIYFFMFSDKTVRLTSVLAYN